MVGGRKAAMGGAAGMRVVVVVAAVFLVGGGAAVEEDENSTISSTSISTVTNTSSVLSKTTGAAAHQTSAHQTSAARDATTSKESNVAPTSMPDESSQNSTNGTSGSGSGGGDGTTGRGDDTSGGGDGYQNPGNSRGYSGYNYGGGYGGYGGYEGYGYGGGAIVKAPPCNQTLQNNNLVPSSLVVFQASSGDSYSIGEAAFLLLKFPDSSCKVPDPGLLKGCLPKLEVNIAQKSSTGFKLSAAPSTAQVQSDYNVDFTEEPGLYTASGSYSPPWVFILQVIPGMRTASLDVVSLTIPPNCSGVNATFNQTVKFSSKTLQPQGISIDTTPPQIVSVYTTEKKGNYTAGHFIDIIVKFSKDVEISELPDKYSDVYLNAQAAKRQLFGVPYLELNSIAFVALRGYDNLNDRSKLSFLYEVGTGEETPDGMQLEIAPNTTIQLNGGAISGDQNGLDADLETMPQYFQVGSLSEKSQPKIFITKTGEKFPPLKYDPSSTPDTATVASTRRNGQITSSKTIMQPTLVSLDFQLNSIFNVLEKSQQLQADFILISTWTDNRLANPSAPAVTMYSTSVLDSGTIWSPKLTFQNRRDLTNYIEGVVRVYNTGRVMVTQRFIASYAVSLNMRDFPFDTQTFAWNVRSTTYPNTVVKFVPASADSTKNSSALLANLLDPTFTYSNYNQTAYTLITGIFTGYDMLSITIQATRIATMSSVFLIFPLCLVSTALCMCLHQEPAKDSRLSVPLSTITATMAFSFVISNVCPPVSYMTRIHLLIFQTYVFSVVALLINYYLWCIEFGKKELSQKNAANKTLLQDAHWMPRKIKPSNTNVVVLPEGIHKPPEKPKEPDTAEASDKASGVVAEASPTEGKKSEDKKAESNTEISVAVKGNSVAPEPKPKSKETGAYPDKEGKYMDVKDLLESDEVKTFKKLKWGGGPIKMFMGLAEITNSNATSWSDHVTLIDRLMKNIFPVCCAVSIGCILGVRNLIGLGSPPMPILGIPA